MPLRLAILTISDAGSRGKRSDSSGDLIGSWAKGRGREAGNSQAARRGNRASW